MAKVQAIVGVVGRVAAAATSATELRMRVLDHADLQPAGCETRSAGQHAQAVGCRARAGNITRCLAEPPAGDSGTAVPCDDSADGIRHGAEPCYPIEGGPLRRRWRPPRGRVAAARACAPGAGGLRSRPSSACLQQRRRRAGRRPTRIATPAEKAAPAPRAAGAVGLAPLRPLLPAAPGSLRQLPPHAARGISRQNSLAAP